MGWWRLTLPWVRRKIPWRWLLRIVSDLPLSTLKGPPAFTIMAHGGADSFFGAVVEQARKGALDERGALQCRRHADRGLGFAQDHGRWRVDQIRAGPWDVEG